MKTIDDILDTDQRGQEIIDELKSESPPLTVGIIGSRHPSALGLEWTRRLASVASREGVYVISGGAEGIDSQAHLSAVENQGTTLALMGAGMNHVNRRLQTLSQRGVGLASPFPPQCPPRRWTYPKRNRYVAELSDQVIVVQATETSGTLYTAREALKLKKNVWVLPHLPSEHLHRGCLKLLSEGAFPLLNDHSWLSGLNITAYKNSSTYTQPYLGDKAPVERTFQPLKPEPSSALWRASTDEPLSLEVLAQKAELSYPQAVLEAMNLELAGWLISAVGVGYKRGYSSS